MKRLLLILMLAIPGLPALCCTTAIVSAGASRSGRPMIWKQRDSGEKNTCVAYVRGGRFGYTGLFTVADTLRRSAYAGINEAGFAIANNLSYNLLPDSLNLAPHNGRLMAEALGSCASLEDFEALLAAKACPMRLSANFAVVDASGGAAYFEVEDYSVVRFDVPEGGYLFRTNFSLSGDEGRGRGYARYATEEALMARKGGRFDAEFFFGMGRSFVNVLTGGDALKGRRDGYIYEHDFIPRSTSTSSVVIEGALPGERPDSGLMWVADGYTPCCYAVPVWVAAGACLPSFITGDAPANRLAERLHGSFSTVEWDSKYLEVAHLSRSIRLTQSFERREFAAGRKLDKLFRSGGFNIEAVERYNAEAADRFNLFYSKFDL
ncbi:MAG: hypothetical protein IJU68_03230 [Bacteroidales bacterium]|nr:hypothetical protein [Bacteroidales bacterium]